MTHWVAISNFDIMMEVMKYTPLDKNKHFGLIIPSTSFEIGKYSYIAIDEYQTDIYRTNNVRTLYHHQMDLADSYQLPYWLEPEEYLFH